MITCAVHDAAGNKVGSVSLDIRKSLAAFRLQQALWDRSSEVIPRHLEMLDCGTLPLSVLSRVYPARDLRAAIVKQAGDLRKSADAADAILDRIESESLWTAGGIRKSKAYDTGHGRDAAEVIDALERYSYRDVSSKKQQFAHRAGYRCSVKTDGSWSHSGAGGRVMSGKGADSLKRLLASVHGAI